MNNPNYDYKPLVKALASALLDVLEQPSPIVQSGHIFASTGNQTFTLQLDPLPPGCEPRVFTSLTSLDSSTCNASPPDYVSTSLQGDVLTIGVIVSGSRAKVDWQVQR